MKRAYALNAGLLCAVLLTAALQGCTGAVEVASIAPSTPIVIDGKADDWQGHLLYYRDAKLTIGVSNDKNFLYLCVMSSDQTVYRSILMRGITVWFDTTGGKGQYFGIRYPLEMAEAEMPMNREEPPGSMDDMMKRRADDASKLAVLGAKKDSRTEILLPGKHGVDARIGYKTGVFVYEMKLPLGTEIADGLTLGFSPDNLLSIRFETPEADKRMGRMMDRSQGGLQEGGMNGDGTQDDAQGEPGRGQQRGGGHRQGGMTPVDASHKMQSIDLFMKVLKAK
jgi:hypothetical protein